LKVVNVKQVCVSSFHYLMELWLNIRSEFMHITIDICYLLQLLSIRTVLRSE